MILKMVKIFLAIVYILANFETIKCQFQDICVEGEACNLISQDCTNLVRNATSTYPNYANLTTPELIQRLSYPVEIHEVVTDDGYILTIHRIPYSTASPATSGKIPVYLMHGIFASSAQWFWQPPSRALVFMLVDAGFDVWIGNARGTTYSQKHVRLNSTEDVEYWNFSVQEMALYDIPAAINYITAYTFQQSLYYVGHSLGNKMIFVGMTLRPEIIPKIRTVFSIATAAYLGRLSNPFFRSIAPFMSIYQNAQIVTSLGGGQFFPALLSPYVGNLTELCVFEAVDCGLCNTIFGLMFGFDPCQADLTQLPGVLAHLPDTTSVRTFSHLAQDTTFGTFSQYDYGPALNRQRYGTGRPPSYDWSKIVNASVVIYYGLNDNLAVPLDVQRTAKALGKNVKLNLPVPCATFSHMDAILGKDADILLYNPIIDIMKNQRFG